MLQQQFPIPYPNYSQYTPSMTPLYPTTQATIQQLPQLAANQNPPKPTQMPSQLVLNPNNKETQPTFNDYMNPFLTYLVTLMPLKNRHLRSGKVLKPRDSTVVMRKKLKERKLMTNK